MVQKIWNKIWRYLLGGMIILVISIQITCISALFVSFQHTEILIYEPTLLIEDRYHNFIASFENDEDMFGFWPLPDTLPYKITRATIAAEDWRFYDHAGVDARSVIRAVHSNYISKKSYSGASTIAMQVVRMQSKKKDRSHFRKTHEALSALWMTREQGREPIMRQYLTIAPYGNRIAGVNYASRRYYQKPLVDLSWAEASLLAALPNAPGRMNIYTSKGLRSAKERAESVLRKCHHLGFITANELTQSLSELGFLTIPEREKRPEKMIHTLQAAQKYLENNRHKITVNPLNPTVRLTIDSDMHDSVHTILKRHFQHNRQFDAENCAAIVVDRKSGELLSYHGSESYFNSDYSGQIDFAQTKRSTGSLLKPFIFACGMEWNGYTPATLLTDIGLYFGEGNAAFAPLNYDKKYLGPVLYKTALANSRNVPAVQVLKDVGVEEFYRKLGQLKIADDDSRHDYYGLGIAVGNFYSSLYDMTQGYLTLANEGTQKSITWLYDAPKEEGAQLYEKEVMLQLQRMLSDPLARLPSFPRGGFLEYSFPVAVKTGTSRGYRDAWAIAWSEEYLVGVWIGRANNKPMKGISGYGGAAPLLQDIMEYLHRDKVDGLSNIAFQPPKGYKPYMINTLTGEQASTNSAWATMEYFRPGTEPVGKNDPMKWVSLDKRSDLLATPLCPPSQIVSKKFLHLPAIFKDWAHIQGLPTPPQEYCSLCGGKSVVEKYALSITAPINKSTLYVDPEMPEGYSTITLNCSVKPQAKSVLWEVDGKEFTVAKYPYRVSWPLKAGNHIFRARIPGTPFMSRPVSIEVY